MRLFSKLSLLVALASPALFACASEAPTTEGTSDEDFTAAGTTYPSDLITALKKANRPALLPTSTIAYVYRPGAMDAVILNQKYNDGSAPGSSELAVARETLKARGLKIVGKNAPFRDCEFTASGDYLAPVSKPTFLSKTMTALNTAMGDEPIFSAQEIASAKAIEATITYKLVLTKERMAVYLGKKNGKWMILGLDQAEFSCDA